MQCLGQQQDLPAAEYALLMCPCMAKCAPSKLLLPFIAYSLPLGSLQQTIHQRLPHPHIKGGGAGPAPHRISKLPCLHLSSRRAHHTIIITID
eukprot:1095188-Pelagomonas_calceolata.AAC.7